MLKSHSGQQGLGTESSLEGSSLALGPGAYNSAPHPTGYVLTSSTTTRNLLLVLSTGLTPESHWTLEKILAGPISTWPG